MFHVRGSDQRRHGVDSIDGVSAATIATLAPFFGYAFYKAWLTVTQHERLLIDPAGWNPHAMMLTHVLTSAAFAACSLVIALTMHGRSGRLADRRALPWLGAATFVLGTLLGAAGGSGWAGAGAAASMLVVAGGVLCGAGSGLAFALWGEVYAGMSHRWVRICALATLAVPALFTSAALLPWYGSLAAAVLLGAGCFGCLAATHRRVSRFASRLKQGTANSMATMPGPVADAHCEARTHPSRPMPLTLHGNVGLVCGVAAICAGYGFLQTTLTVNVGPGPLNVAYVAAALVAALVIAVTLFDHADDPDHAREVAIIVSLLVVGYLLYPMGVYEPVRFASIVLVDCGFFLFEYLLVICLADLAGRCRAKPAVLFSASRVVVTSAVLAGMLLALATLRFVPDPRADRLAGSALVAVSVAVLALAGIWLLGPRALHRFFWGETPADAGSAEHLAQRCEQVARRFGLTGRELEILQLWAQGRSAPYIQEALVISGSTVATHTRHIYQKCGVHSRQELLDLLARG